MVVADRIVASRHELVNAQPLGRCPDITNQRPRITPRSAIAFLIDRQIGVADHIQQDAPAIAIFLSPLEIRSGEILRADEEPAVFAIHVLLGVEQHEINAVLGLQRRHLVGQLHKDRHAAGPVVGPDELSATVHRIAQRERQCVVMGTEQDSLGPLRMPANDHIADGHLGVGFPEEIEEPLHLDLGARFLEMVGQKFLGRGHAGRTARSRANGANLLQILVSPLPVEGDVVERKPRAGRPGVLGPFDLQRSRLGARRRLRRWAVLVWAVTSRLVWSWAVTVGEEHVGHHDASGRNHGPEE